MEEINNVGEQPESTDIQTVATDVENGITSTEGSPLGKFKSAETLLDAYNELQGEFTRKCQKLSEVEKKLQESELKCVPEQQEAKLSENEFAWQSKISEFLQSHEKASDFVEEITNEIISDEDLKNQEDGLEKAYSRVLEKKYSKTEELVEDEEFLEKFIFSNEKIKNKIIKEYVNSLQFFQSPININNSGVTRGVASSNNVSSLEDAKRVVENMFKF